MFFKEPTSRTLRFKPFRYFYSARPGMLVASSIPVLIGTATAIRDAHTFLPGGLCLAAVITALIHSAANVYNDCYDEGNDDKNEDRLFPFTGGSRSIQNGILNGSEMKTFAHCLIGLSLLISILTIPIFGFGALCISIVGGFLAWAYSAPPIRLSHRGLGELAVAVSFGLLVPLGADCIQRGGLSTSPLLFGTGYALVMTAVLLICEFPDCQADVSAGKRHWLARLGPGLSLWILAIIVAAAYICLPFLFTQKTSSAFIGQVAISLTLHLVGLILLIINYKSPGKLMLSIIFTLMGTLSYGILVTVSILSFYSP